MDFKYLQAVTGGGRTSRWLCANTKACWSQSRAAKRIHAKSTFAESDSNCIEIAMKLFCLFFYINGQIVVSLRFIHMS